MTQTTTTRSSSRRDSSRPAPLPAGGDLGAPDARQAGTSKPFQTVYTIVERERDGQKFWLKIGAAFVNRDGSLHVKLDAMPTNGQLHIRESKSFEERQQDAERAVEQ